MDEITFEIEETPKGGYIARAREASIFTEAESRKELHEMIRDAMMCHFGEDAVPSKARLLYMQEEVLAV